MGGNGICARKRRRESSFIDSEQRIVIDLPRRGIERSLREKLHGSFTVNDQIELCRLYSAEVEYSDDNLNALFDALM